jgi:hypothetical protein
MPAHKRCGEQSDSSGWGEVSRIAAALLGLGIVMAFPYTFFSGWNWWLYGSAIFATIGFAFVLVFLATVPVYIPGEPNTTRVSPYFWPVVVAFIFPALMVYLTHCLERAGWSAAAELLYQHRIGAAGGVLICGVLATALVDWWRRVDWWRPTWIASFVFIAFMAFETMKLMATEWSIRFMNHFHSSLWFRVVVCLAVWLTLIPTVLWVASAVSDWLVYFGDQVMMEYLQR